MTWEKPNIIGNEPYFYGFNTEKRLRFYSISRDREMYDSDKKIEGIISYSASLIMGEDDIFLPFLCEDRYERGEQGDPFQRHITDLGLNLKTEKVIIYSSVSVEMPYFTITANHERIEEYFNLIAEAYFELDEASLARYVNDVPSVKHRCTAFIYICPETKKEFIKKNPYL